MRRLDRDGDRKAERIDVCYTCMSVILLFSLPFVSYVYYWSFYLHILIIFILPALILMLCFVGTIHNYSFVPVPVLWFLFHWSASISIALDYLNETY